MINKRLKRGFNGKLKLKMPFPCFLLVAIEKVLHGCALSRSRVPIFATPWITSTRHLCPWDHPGKNTRVGCCALLQGIFLTQGSNPHLLGLLHWQVHSLPLSHQGSPFKEQVRFMQVLGGVSRGMGGWASLWAEWKRTLWVSPSPWHHSIVGWWWGLGMSFTRGI